MSRRADLKVGSYVQRTCNTIAVADVNPIVGADL